MCRRLRSRLGRYGMDVIGQWKLVNNDQHMSNARTGDRRLLVKIPPPRLTRTRPRAMSLSIARLHSSLRVPCLHSTVITRRAMMSALRNNHPNTTPALPNSPPVTIPTASMSPDAAAPQTAAPPPPAPKAERQRPKIRATKAALTLVRYPRTLDQSGPHADFSRPYPDTRSSLETTKST